MKYIAHLHITDWNLLGHRINMSYGVLGKAGDIIWV